MENVNASDWCMWDKVKRSVVFTEADDLPKPELKSDSKNSFNLI